MNKKNFEFYNEQIIINKDYENSNFPENNLNENNFKSESNEINLKNINVYKFNKIKLFQSQKFLNIIFSYLLSKIKKIFLLIFENTKYLKLKNLGYNIGEKNCVI